MLQLRHSASSTSPRRASTATRLGVAWVHGEFAVVAGSTAGDGRVWCSPQPVSDPAGLVSALRTAVAETGFGGRQVYCVLAHPRLVQTRIEMPPMRGEIRRRFLKRQVEQASAADGPVHWSCRPAVSSSTAEAVVLHRLSEAFHRELSDACRAAGLDLALLLPLSELLATVRPPGEVSGGDLALIAVPLSGWVEMTVVRDDGVPALSRPPVEDRPGSGGRLAGEMNRTLQYVRQTFSSPVRCLFWLGGDSVHPVATPAGMPPLPVRVIQGRFDAGFWAGTVTQQSPSHPANLVTREQHEAPGRRAVGTIHRVLAIASLSAAAFFGIYAETVRIREQGVVRRLRPEVSRLAAREGELGPRVDAIGNHRAFLSAAEASPPPLPLWLLASLGETVPEEVRITNFVVETRDAGWHFRIAGSRPAEVGRLPDSVALLSNAISGSPFFAQWPELARVVPTEGTPTHWAARLRDRRSNRDPVRPKFSLEGRIQ